MVGQIIRRRPQIIIDSITKQHMIRSIFGSHFVSHPLTASKANAYQSIGYALNEMGNGAAETLEFLCPVSTQVTLEQYQ